MATFGSILMITGAIGLAGFLLILTLKPAILPRNVATIILIALFALTGSGLVLIAVTSGGRSLHTGG